MEQNDILLARLDERYKALDNKLDSILEQVIKTNGRVNGHDDKIHELFNWKSEVKGNWKATTAIGAIVGATVSTIIGIFK